MALIVDSSLQSEIHEGLLKIYLCSSFAPVDVGTFEAIFVHITIPEAKPLLVGSLYRPPDTDPITFQLELEKVMTSIDRNKKTTYICGDYNMNLLNIDTHHHTNDFLNLMSTFLFYPLIQAPTRITSSSSTLIDNIFTNSLSYKECPGILLTDFSDHLPIFTIIDSKPPVNNKRKLIAYRPKNDQALANFTAALSNEDWAETSSLASPDLILESVNTKLLTLYNLNYPVVVRRARIYKTKMKPWMSPALLKSCKTKNILYKRYLNSKDNTALVKYKVYKNKLTNILR